MPRSGAYTVSDLPRDRLCRIVCQRCGRAGAYRREALAARFGDMALRGVLIALTVRGAVISLGHAAPATSTRQVLDDR